MYIIYIWYTYKWRSNSFLRSTTGSAYGKGGSGWYMKEALNYGHFFSFFEFSSTLTLKTCWIQIFTNSAQNGLPPFLSGAWLKWISSPCWAYALPASQKAICWDKLVSWKGQSHRSRFFYTNIPIWCRYYRTPKLWHFLRQSPDGRFPGHTRRRWFQCVWADTCKSQKYGANGNLAFEKTFGESYQVVAMHLTRLDSRDLPTSHFHSCKNVTRCC